MPRQTRFTGSEICMLALVGLAAVADAMPVEGRSCTTGSSVGLLSHP